ncbi:MAG: sulfotransferase [Pseudomonadota bacterium]
MPATPSKRQAALAPPVLDSLKRFRAGHFGPALALARRASESAKTPAELDTLGSVLSACGDLGAAHRCFERATAQAADTPHFVFNLGTSLRAVGQIEASEAAFERVLALKPHDWDAHLAISTLRQQTRDHNHLDRLGAALARTKSEPTAQVKLRYALAKEYEDLGEYASAFEHLASGASLRRQHSHYDVASDLNAMATIREVFTAEVLAAAGAGCDSGEPLFILGLPRTGSTLCERILGAHSAVQSCGELQQFAVELVKLARGTAAKPGVSKHEPRGDKLELIKRSPGLSMEALGQRYIDSTRPLTGEHAHFIDKMPLNFLYIGLISMALPGARIIHLKRGAMDSCYAIFKTYFQQTYPYSYDLEDLGRYYLAYRDLMAHWEQALPGKIIHVDYEALVADQEGVTRALLADCGLEWQAQCLDFHEVEQPTATASATQVRQRMSSGSVGKWRHYEEQLEPLARMLTEGGVELS